MIHTQLDLDQLTLTRPAETVAVCKAHKACFCSRNQGLLNRATQHIGSALEVRNAAIVIATVSHRDSLLKSLHDYGLNMDAAVDQGRYLALDAAGLLSTSMVNDAIDGVACFRLLHNLTLASVEAATIGQS